MLPLFRYPEYNLFTLRERLIPIEINAGSCEEVCILFLDNSGVFLFVLCRYDYFRFLFYSPLVQRLGVSAGIGHMLFICSCKVVGTTKVFFSTHIQVIMLCMVEYGFNACY